MLPPFQLDASVILNAQIVFVSTPKIKVFSIFLVVSLWEIMQVTGSWSIGWIAVGVGEGYE